VKRRKRKINKEEVFCYDTISVDTGSMEKSPSSDVDSRSAGQEIPCLL
jgi:hypothetical protein